MNEHRLMPVSGKHEVDESEFHRLRIHNSAFFRDDIPETEPVTTPEELAYQLDGLLDASLARIDRWGAWHYSGEPYRQRVITPWFDSRLAKHGILAGIRPTTMQTRLHVAFESSVSPQPIIHVERGTRELILEGFEVVWNRHRPDIEPMVGIGETRTDDWRYHHVNANDTDLTYWRTLTSIIDKACSEFDVPPRINWQAPDVTAA